MKKLIAFFSVALMAGCMYALAADDSGTTGDVSKSADSTMGQAGSAAEGATEPAQDAMKSTTESTTTTVKKTEQQAKRAKTCVDESGNTLKKGEAGFKDCMKRQMSKEQGGTMASPESKSENYPSEQSPSTSDSSTQSSSS